MRVDNRIRRGKKTCGKDEWREREKEKKRVAKKKKKKKLGNNDKNGKEKNVFFSFRNEKSGTKRTYVNR